MSKLEAYYREKLCRQLQSPSYLAKQQPKRIKTPQTVVELQDAKTVLEAHSYDVTASSDRSYRITGNGIYGYLVIDDDYHADGLYVDHKGCFNKLRDCPCTITFPCTVEQLITALKQIGSDLGLKASKGMWGPNSHDNPFTHTITDPYKNYVS